MDLSKVDAIEVDGIDTRDYPDFCDAFISYAEYEGREMTEQELDKLNDDYDFVYEQIEKRIY